MQVIKTFPTNASGLNLFFDSQKQIRESKKKTAFSTHSFFQSQQKSEHITGYAPYGDTLLKLRVVF